ncbi:hypothetical protein F444_10322 [Phytophthora nicotianae P1976]|uniref:Uncharacterized protein n=1 Tax=Phytophthora nicotianae P1976 TaxID=1317066 RepID=A0A081A4H2_PHYNI|nr:hypothetical protein F444_10322 [Phytophthora nicotianae P1976]
MHPTVARLVGQGLVPVVRRWEHYNPFDFAEDVASLIDMLEKNDIFQYFEVTVSERHMQHLTEFRKQHNKLIRNRVKLPRENKIAFLSVLSPESNSSSDETKRQRHASMARSTLYGIERLQRVRVRKRENVGKNSPIERLAHYVSHTTRGNSFRSSRFLHSSSNQVTFMLGLAVGEYKRATDFFLDWLRRAGGDNHHAGKRVQAINDVVKEIASDPSTLTPELLEELHTALDACQYSIMLRECVAAVYPEEDERQVGHQHFLKSLRRWYSMLQGIEVGIPPELDDDEDHWGYQRFLNLLQNRHSTAREVKVKTHPKWVNMQLENSNCYEVLHGDVDYISDEEDFAAEKGTSKTADVKRERLFGKAFAVKKGASKTVKRIDNFAEIAAGHDDYDPLSGKLHCK